MSLRDQIFAVADRPLKPIEVWGLTVYIQRWDGEARAAWESYVSNASSLSGAEIRCKAIVMALCDESGNLQFTDADIPALMKKSCIELDALFTAIIAHNRVGGDKIEAAEKN